MSSEKLPKVKLSLVDVGRRLNEVREALGLNQSELAELLGLSQGMISLVLKGKKGLSMERLVALYEAHHVNLNWLLIGAGPMFNGDQIGTVQQCQKCAAGPYPELETREFLLARLKAVTEYVEEVWPEGAHAPRKYRKRAKRKKRGRTG